jgi:uncharacterized membrane protein YphA (DoxX/SURF4 family)
MQPWSLLLLRVTVGGLLVWWGLDKLVNVAHGIAVAQHFYFGVGSHTVFLQALGILEIGIGALVVLGWGRRWAYPALLLFTGITVLGVWKSIVDPWGWIFEGTNALFYPSAVIFAGSLVLWAFRDLDRLVLDRRAAG